MFDMPQGVSDMMTPEELEKHILECKIDDCDICYEYFSEDEDDEDDK